MRKYLWRSGEPKPDKPEEPDPDVDRFAELTADEWHRLLVERSFREKHRSRDDAPS